MASQTDHAPTVVTYLELEDLDTVHPCGFLIPSREDDRDPRRRVSLLGDYQLHHSGSSKVSNYKKLGTTRRRECNAIIAGRSSMHMLLAMFAQLASDHDRFTMQQSLDAGELFAQSFRFSHCSMNDQDLQAFIQIEMDVDR